MWWKQCLGTLEGIAVVQRKSWCKKRGVRRHVSLLYCCASESGDRRVPHRSLCSRVSSAPSDSDEVPKKPVPVSYMGLGFDKIRYNRRKLLKEAKNPHTEAEDNNTLPVYLSHLWKTNTHQFRKLYPNLVSIFEERDTAVEPSTLPEEVYQYPFQQFGTPQGDHGGKARVAEVCAYDVLQQRDLQLSKFLRSLDSSKTRSDITEEVELLRKELWRVNYGSADPTVAPSNVPCGGCGAFLHCSDISIPGYMPSEVFTKLSGNELHLQLCQRCLYLQHYNTALNVKVDRDMYKTLLSEIRHKKALALLMVDLTDMPCSLWHNVSDILGPEQPLLVVANKVDLLPCDKPGYLKRVKTCVEQNLRDAGFSMGGRGAVKGICIISAKTGYGVEDLITQLHDVWRMKGDVYLIGCTNVGKSTLFNMLLQSDLCQESATDLVQRATTSVWPGTTLNLLKFPILRPAGWQLHLRLKRLQKENAILKQEVDHRRRMYQTTRKPEYAMLIGRIGMTFKKQERDSDTSTVPQSSNLGSSKLKASHFCYDTPGAVYKDQILDLLTLDELLKIVPKEIITPRTILLRLNQTLFISGLARVDLLEVPRSQHIYVTVFASGQLPIHVVDTPDAQDFYKAHLGSEMLGVPLGSAKRLASLPALEEKELRFTGEGWNYSCGDIVLSSVGWVSLTFNMDEQATVRAWTPEGRGIYRRVPAMLPCAVLLRGKRIRGTPTYSNQKCTAI